MVNHEDQKAAACALLMREVLCELIYRRRQRLLEKVGTRELGTRDEPPAVPVTLADLEHVNALLGTRDIDPLVIVPFAVIPHIILELDKAALRRCASDVLDQLVRAGKFKV